MGSPAAAGGDPPTNETTKTQLRMLLHGGFCELYTPLRKHRPPQPDENHPNTMDKPGNSTSQRNVTIMEKFLDAHVPFHIHFGPTDIGLPISRERVYSILSNGGCFYSARARDRTPVCSQWPPNAEARTTARLRPPSPPSASAVAGDRLGDLVLEVLRVLRLTAPTYPRRAR